MYYTCPRRLGTIRSSLARGMRHRHMMILKSVTFTNDTDSPPRAPPLRYNFTRDRCMTCGTVCAPCARDDADDAADADGFFSRICAVLATARGGRDCGFDEARYERPLHDTLHTPSDLGVQYT